MRQKVQLYQIMLDLIAVFDKLTDFLDEGNYVYLIYLVFGKAFDTMPCSKSLINCGKHREVEKFYIKELN